MVQDSISGGGGVDTGRCDICAYVYEGLEENMTTVRSLPGGSDMPAGRDLLF